MANIDKTTLKEAMSPITNYLLQDRGHSANDLPLVPLMETSSLRIMSRHGESGYIIISACRGDVSEQENARRTRELISKIKGSGLSYTPVFGGYIEDKGMDSEKQVYERSFVIYAIDRKGNPIEPERLYQFGLELAREYNQEAFLWKAPGQNPKYITQNGDTDMEFTGDPSFGRVNNEYFTSLHKTHRKSDRFTFTEAYVRPRPVTYPERVSRARDGEIF